MATLRLKVPNLTEIQKNGKLGKMKTTLELPDEMVREMKIRAAREGRKLKDVAAEIFRRGLACPAETATRTAANRVNLPLVRCRKNAAPGQDLTPAGIAELLVEQEAEWSDEASGR